MNALKLIKTEYNLYDELCTTIAIRGKTVDFVYDFLCSQGIESLSFVTADTLSLYIRHVYKSFIGQPNKFSFYKGALEGLYYIHQSKNGHPLATVPDSDPIYRKCACFLMASGLSDASAIDAALRISFQRYIELSIPSRASEYTKRMDTLKLAQIKKNPFHRTPAYKNEMFYLLYYPDYSVAKRFYYTARKEFLFFDFSVLAPETMKRQIFSGLLSFISKIEKCTNHYIIQHMITPLHYLYDFCIEYRIEDIKRITKRDERLFHEYLKTHMDAQNYAATQILHTMRKHLFLSDRKTDYSATAWFLERFSFGSARMNPTRLIEVFYFDDIYDPENLRLFQEYMKYLLTLSPKYALQTIRQKYYETLKFISFLEANGKNLITLTSDDVEAYIGQYQTKDIQPYTYNKMLMEIRFLFNVLSTREKISLPEFPFDYYYKTAVYLHHDRSVDDQTIDAILSMLGDFPERLGLMFLILYSTGLRVNEVCSLKSDALFTAGDAYWLSVYQYKMKTEKQIPIPQTLYRLLKRFIENSPPSRYIFPAIKHPDRPFRVETFTSQMKEQLKLYGVTENINFRSHDFRHTIATDLHFSNVPLPVTRAFLGHKHEDMTKQYIDHLPGHIDKLQQKYFKENPK